MTATDLEEGSCVGQTSVVKMVEGSCFGQKGVVELKKIDLIKEMDNFVDCIEKLL